MKHPFPVGTLVLVVRDRPHCEPKVAGRTGTVRLPLAPRMVELAPRLCLFEMVYGVEIPGTNIPRDYLWGLAPYQVIPISPPDEIDGVREAEQLGAEART